MANLSPPVVYRESRNRLTRHVWMFQDAPGGGFHLTWYGLQRRESLKHPWRTVRQWDRDSHPYGDAEWVKAEQVPWDPEVQQEVYTAILDRIKLAGPLDSPAGQIQLTPMPET